jgi:3'-phosphoadenosine 5'-phosphosulfate sulfotransferase (PAPS reductase)/FAD synthetase
MPNRPLAIDPAVKSAIEGGARVIFSLSGGKDSSAAAFAVSEYLDRIGHPRQLRSSIHADLGAIEWQKTPAFVERIAKHLNTELTIVRRKAGGLIQRWEQRWASSCLRYENLETFQLVSPWSSASLRFCTSETKVAPLGSHIRKTHPGETIISIVGIRREESASRANSPISRNDARFAPPGNKAGTRMLTWHPILDWSSEDVFAFHRERKIPLHEAYALGSTRLSCSYCVLSSLNNLTVAAASPGNHETFRRIVALESRSGFSFQNSRWLAEVAPQLLDEAEKAATLEARTLADQRRSLEATLPPDLRFKRGWPPRIPDRREAHRIAKVRAEILAAHSLENRWPRPADVQRRFEQLHAAIA